MKNIYNPSADLTGKFSKGRNIAEFNYMEPLSESGNTLPILDLKLKLDNKKSKEINLGLVLRHNYADKAIFGAYAYFDHRTKANNFSISGLTAGVEILSKYIDARVNIYVPENKVHKIKHRNDSLHADSRFIYELSGGHTYESGSKGYDIEIGTPLFALSDSLNEKIGTKIHVAKYRFKGAKTQEVKGTRFRLEQDIATVWLGDDSYKLHMNAETQFDKVNKRQNFIGLGLKITFNDSQNAEKKNINSLSHRMMDTIIRDVDIQTADYSETPYKTFERRTPYVAARPAGIDGDGSKENPYSTRQWEMMSWAEQHRVTPIVITTDNHVPTEDESRVLDEIIEENNYYRRGSFDANGKSFSLKTKNGALIIAKDNYFLDDDGETEEIEILDAQAKTAIKNKMIAISALQSAWEKSHPRDSYNAWVQENPDRAIKTLNNTITHIIWAQANPDDAKKAKRTWIQTHPKYAFSYDYWAMCRPDKVQDYVRNDGYNADTVRQQYDAEAEWAESNPIDAQRESRIKTYWTQTNDDKPMDDYYKWKADYLDKEYTTYLNHTKSQDKQREEAVTEGNNLYSANNQHNWHAQQYITWSQRQEATNNVTISYTEEDARIDAENISDEETISDQDKEDKIYKKAKKTISNTLKANTNLPQTDSHLEFITKVSRMLIHPKSIHDEEYVANIEYTDNNDKITQEQTSLTIQKNTDSEIETFGADHKLVANFVNKIRKLDNDNGLIAIKEIRKSIPALNIPNKPNMRNLLRNRFDNIIRITGKNKITLQGVEISNTILDND